MTAPACAVDVWRLPLDGRAAVDHGLLSDDERRRLAAFRSMAAAHRFGATRTALRRLLAARLSVDARSLDIATGPIGKPFLPAHPALRFNVSHAGALALVALCEQADVGIDLEPAASFADASRLWPTVCSDAEQRWLAAHPERAVQAFGRLWTRKEAVLKALGSGLAAGARAVDFSTHMAATSGTTSGVAWQDLTVADAGFAALAAVGAGPLQVRWHDAIA